MSDKIPFTGMGINPNGPDLPMGFGMQLAQEPEALSAYGKLTNEKKSTVIRYIQDSETGEDAKRRINTALDQLKSNNLSFF